MNRKKLLLIASCVILSSCSNPELEKKFEVELIDPLRFDRSPLTYRLEAFNIKEHDPNEISSLDDKTPDERLGPEVFIPLQGGLSPQSLGSADATGNSGNQTAVEKLSTYNDILGRINNNSNKILPFSDGIIISNTSVNRNMWSNDYEFEPGLDIIPLTTDLMTIYTQVLKMRDTIENNLSAEQESKLNDVLKGVGVDIKASQSGEIVSYKDNQVEIRYVSANSQGTMDKFSADLGLESDKNQFKSLVKELKDKESKHRTEILLGLIDYATREAMDTGSIPLNITIKGQYGDQQRSQDKYNKIINSFKDYKNYIPEKDNNEKGYLSKINSITLSVNAEKLSKGQKAEEVFLNALQGKKIKLTTSTVLHTNIAGTLDNSNKSATNEKTKTYLFPNYIQLSKSEILARAGVAVSSYVGTNLKKESTVEDAIDAGIKYLESLGKDSDISKEDLESIINIVNSYISGENNKHKIEELSETINDIDFIMSYYPVTLNKDYKVGTKVQRGSSFATLNIGKTNRSEYLLPYLHISGRYAKSTVNEVLYNPIDLVKHNYSTDKKSLSSYKESKYSPLIGQKDEQMGIVPFFGGTNSIEEMVRTYGGVWIVDTQRRVSTDVVSNSEQEDENLKSLGEIFDKDVLLKNIIDKIAANFPTSIIVGEGKNNILLENILLIVFGTSEVELKDISLSRENNSADNGEQSKIMNELIDKYHSKSPYN